MVVKSISLSGVDLFKGPHKGSLELSETDIQNAFPGNSNWKSARVTIQVCDDTNHDGRCSDEETKELLTVDALSFSAVHIPDRMFLDVRNGRYYDIDDNPGMCEEQVSPLVLDLSGQGIQLSGPENGVVFDINATGVPVPTGWIASSTNGFLVRDLNGNGMIDSGAEMFGTATVMSNGQRAASGFAALAELDADGDGYITPADPAYDSLMVWVDKNFNGITEPGELYTLRQLHIDAISVNAVSVQEVDVYGNTTKLRSQFRRSWHGQSTFFNMIDVWFDTLVVAH